MSSGAAVERRILMGNCADDAEATPSYTRATPKAKALLGSRNEAFHGATERSKRNGPGSVQRPAAGGFESCLDLWSGSICRKRCGREGRRRRLPGRCAVSSALALWAHASSRPRPGWWINRALGWAKRSCHMSLCSTALSAFSATTPAVDGYCAARLVKMRSLSGLSCVGSLERCRPRCTGPDSHEQGHKCGVKGSPWAMRGPALRNPRVSVSVPVGGVKEALACGLAASLRSSVPDA